MRKSILGIAMMLSAIVCSCGKGISKKELFNGENLEGWTCVLDEKSDVPTSEVYGVKDGNIHIVGNPFGYMRTDKKYSNYKLHMEWRWVGEGTNSGLFLHVQDGDKLWPNAIECQLCNGKAGDFVMLGGSKISEIECVGQFPIKDRVGNFEKPVGEWNIAEVVCQGNSITVYINGQLQNQATSETSEGYIALQSEGGSIEFRNVYLTELNGKDTIAKDSIALSYDLLKNDDPRIKDCIEEEPQYAFDVTLKGKINGTPYKLYQVHIKEGKAERTEIKQEKTCIADSIQHILFASIMESKESVRIICNHQAKNDIQVSVPTFRSILMETYPAIKQTKEETIPLIAFTEGTPQIFEIAGRKLEGLDYCGVRDAKIHPSRWFEKFHIKDYVYFEIDFQQ